MVAEIQTTVVGIEALREFLKEFPNANFDIVKQEFTDRTLAVHKTVLQKFNGTRLTSRTGALRRSFQTKVTGDSLNDLDARVYSGSIAGKPIIYAIIHEFGGTVKAKKAYQKLPGGPYLNIPLSGNKTKAGVTRYSAFDIFSAGGFIIKSKAGNWIVMSKGMIPMFVLKKQVHIPPRLAFFSTGKREANRVLPNLSKKLPEAWSKI